MPIETNPPHIRIETNANRVRVRSGGETVCDTRRALRLLEGGHRAVLYVPREDVAMNLLRRNDHTSQCPHKGQATYFSITAGGRTVQNAAWSYELPFAVAAAIAGYLAFDPAHVDSIEETGN